MFQILLQNNLDLNLVNKKGNTPLNCAVKNGHCSCASLLLDMGADANIANSCGDSPLHWASRRGDLDMVFKLIVIEVLSLIQILNLFKVVNQITMY